MELDTLVNDELFAAGLEHFVQQSKGENGIDLLKGTAVALITSNGNFDAFNAGGAGGREIFHGVLAEDFDSTVETDQSAALILAGAVNEDKIIFTGTGDKNTTRKDARLLGIFYAKVLPAV